MAEPIGLVEAQRAIAANTDDRARWFSVLEAYVKGTQYAGRPDWFAGECPLLERAPCIVYPGTKNAIRSTVSMVLGEGRFPAIECTAADDTNTGEDALPKPDAEALTAFVNGTLKAHARLPAALRRMLREAQGSGSSVSILCARGGHLVIDSVLAKWCTPAFVENGRPSEVESLTIQYPYLHKYWSTTSRVWAFQARLFRRVIDATRDVTYVPIVAPIDGAPVTPGAWVEDPTKTIVHDLGFCPAVWYAYERGDESGEGFDGKAIHAEMLDEIDALNFSLSQRHRAALYTGDPQVIESGVSEEDVILDGTVTRVLVEKAAMSDGSTAFYMQSTPTAAKPARRKGAGIAWRYGNPESKAYMLTLPGDALDAIDNNAKDLKSKLDETFSVVFLDPGNSALRIGELSGSAIRKLYMRQTAHCDEIREEFGDFAILPMVDMLLRMMATLLGRGQALFLRGVNPVGKALASCLVPGADGKPGWRSPWLALTWGEYFDDSADDELARVRVAAEASAARLITKTTAVTKVAPMFGVKDVDAEVKEIADEADEHGSLEQALGVMSGAQFGKVATTFKDPGQAKPSLATPGDAGP